MCACNKDNDNNVSSLSSYRVSCLLFSWIPRDEAAAAAHPSFSACIDPFLRLLLLLLLLLLFLRDENSNSSTASAGEWKGVVSPPPPPPLLPFPPFNSHRLQSTFVFALSLSLIPKKKPEEEKKTNFWCVGIDHGYAEGSSPRSAAVAAFSYRELNWRASSLGAQRNAPLGLFFFFFFFFLSPPSSSSSSIIINSRPFCRSIKIRLCGNNISPPSPPPPSSLFKV